MSNPTAKGGNIILQDFSLPETVMPGESVTAEITVGNGATTIAPWDNDHCGQSGFATVGYELRAVLVKPSGEKLTTDLRCHGTTEVFTADHTYEITFTAPETEADHTYQAYVELPGSGETTSRTSEYLTVTEDAPTSGDGSGSGSSPSNPLDDLLPDGDDNGRGDGGDDSSGDGSGGGGLFGGLFGGGSGGGLFSNMKIVLVLVIVLAVLVSTQ